MYLENPDLSIYELINEAVKALSLELPLVTESDYYQAFKALKKRWRDLRPLGLMMPKTYPSKLKVTNSGDQWIVVNTSKGTEYSVTLDPTSCTCEANAIAHLTCSHIQAVWAAQTEEIELVDDAPWQDELSDDPSPVTDPHAEGLTGQQAIAFQDVLKWFEKPLQPFVFKGYAGTGKSFSIQRIILALLARNPKLKIALCAPTHKARKVLQSFADKAGLNIDIYTIHSLLHVVPDKPDENGNTPLRVALKNAKHYREYDLVVVDESSMVGTELLRHIIVTPKKHEHLGEVLEQRESLTLSMDDAQNRGDLNYAQYLKDKLQALNKDIQMVMATGWRPDHTIQYIFNTGKFLAPTLFLGDPAQLPPVEDDAKVAPVFEFPGGIELSEVVRYEGAIAQYVTALRQNITRSFPPKLKSEGNIAKYFPAEWEKQVVRAFADGDPSEIRTLAWTNQRVNKLNSLIRSQLFDTDSPYLVGEQIIAKEGIITYVQNEYGEDQQQMLMHSCQEATVKASEEVLINYQGVSVDCLRLTLQLDSEEEISILSAPPGTPGYDTVKQLAAGCKQSALSAENRGDRAKSWREYYRVLDVFSLSPAGNTLISRLQYAYAMTVHQSQGSTFNTVFVDTQNILGCKDVEMRNRLLYVAYTRASEKLIVSSSF